MNEKNTLYIVVPCYKEQEVLPETSRRLREKMRQLMDEGKISRRSRVMFVNDGSSDNTWAIISELHEMGKVGSGSRVLVVGFGGGLTWGGAMIEFA